MKRHATTALAFLIAGVLAYTPLDGDDSVKPGRLELDPPTLICLGVRWPIEGDDNRNATVKMWYREDGTRQWKQGLPLFRSNTVDIPYGRVVPNMFCGSIFDLEPGTRYEIRLQMEDRDGGGTEKVIKTSTRPVPVAPKNARVKHCTPQNLQATIDAASPGTVIEIGPGVFRGTLDLSAKKGTAEKPIVIKGAEGGKTVLKGNGGHTVVNANGSQYVYLEQLVIRGPAMVSCIECDKARGLVVRRCVLYAPSEKGHGINNTTVSRPGRDFLIVDSVFEGVREWPRKYTYGGADPFAISICGTGHVVCYNSFRNWNTAIQGADKLREVYLLNNIDIYNNEIRFCLASAIEVDCGTHNIRVFRNRLTNCYIGISTQPIYGGPCYVFRNVMYNILHTPYKMHNGTSGMLYFHNTTLRAGPAYFCWAKEPVRDVVWRNNLTLGGGGKAWKGPSGDKAWENWNKYINPNMDYDGFTEGRVIFNSSLYASLDDFIRTNPLRLEKHGVVVDLSIFAKPVKYPQAQDPNTRYLPPDLRLKPVCTATDRGCVLHGINDGYRGKAPDLGAYEEGQPLPHYGPRP